MMRERLKATGSPGMVISQLDEVAWLMNLRGNDIPFNPVCIAICSPQPLLVISCLITDSQVFFAYAILTYDKCTLFVIRASLGETVRKYLQANGVAVLDYEQIWNSLEGLGQLALSHSNRHETDEAFKTSEPEKAKEPAEKTIKMDKVLIGDKSSWAVAKAVGEVSC